MPPVDQEAWKRLGRLLADRRIQVGARYRNKNLFAEERQINRRMLWQVESGERDTYRPDTIRAIESAYELVPGSLARTLAGGALEPSGEARSGPPRPRLEAVPDRPSLPDDPTDKDLHYFIAAQEPYELRKLLLDTLYFEAVKYPERIRGIRALTDPVDLGEAPAERRREPGA